LVAVGVAVDAMPVGVADPVDVAVAVAVAVGVSVAVAVAVGVSVAVAVAVSVAVAVGVSVAVTGLARAAYELALDYFDAARPGRAPDLRASVGPEAPL
jgi:hypothetical protein